MRRSLQPILFFLAMCLPLKAQTYRMEAGLLAGVSSYMGDANRQLIANPQPFLSGMARYNLNSRFSLKAELGMAGLKGSTTGQSQLYPNGIDLDFERRIGEGSVQLEFNFYEFGAPDYTPGLSRVSPYVLAGIGGIVYEADRWRATALLPVGLGVRCKIPGTRLNAGLEASIRLSFSDRLDYSENGSGFQLNDPMVTSAWNKNKDNYTGLRLFVSYDFWYNGSTCYRD